MATTFNQLRDQGTAKRADAWKVRLEEIHIRPGFNLRDPEERDENGKTFQESIDELADLIADGMPIPPLEVVPREEGGVWLVDGECRTRALWKLDTEGRLARTPSKTDPSVTDYWVSVVPFDGDEEEQEDRIFTSNKNRRLTDLEMARGCQRKAARGRKPDEIAKAIGMTRQRVDQLLALASAPPEVQQGVRDGVVSGAEAVKLVRKHGEKAGEALAEELEKAKAQGKGKVTAGTIKGPSVPRSLLDDLHQTATKLHAAFKPDDLVAIDRFHRGEITEGTVTISVEAAMQVHLILEEAQRVLEEKQRKAREKADKAKQLELQEGAV
ncbi:hypothetical protein [Pseudomonas phage Persinger]|uniref:ParB/Spo0J HTH domain-containing protein n=1 Tax=Pseudomonas phage Persinger TaxID=2749430 RepID=A0A7D7FB20_9CAUD|nr:ParB-like partition protein [Pseudomonas phage Persinger]QMP19201.1 hypothetical protein [Pseudomonas phage Persinger]